MLEDLGILFSTDPRPRSEGRGTRPPERTTQVTLHGPGSETKPMARYYYPTQLDLCRNGVTRIKFGDGDFGGGLFT